jgi:Tfp pilus assembly protein PilV
MKNRSSAGLFLMEIIIALLFFSICSAICVNLFAKSALLARTAGSTEDAVLLAENAAAAYKSSGGDAVQTASILGGSASSGSVSVSYGEDRSVSASDAVYSLVISPKGGTYSEKAGITVSDSSGRTLFSMDVGAMGGDGG